MFQLMRACKSLDTYIAKSVTVTINIAEQENRISWQSENDLSVCEVPRIPHITGVRVDCGTAYAA